MNSNDCKRCSSGSCIDGDHVDKCVGKDCGAYEPNCTNLSNSSEADLRISVAKLREILVSRRGNLLNDAVIEKIIKRVKKKI